MFVHIEPRKAVASKPHPCQLSEEEKQTAGGGVEVSHSSLPNLHGLLLAAVFFSLEISSF